MVYDWYLSAYAMILVLISDDGTYPIAEKQHKYHVLFYT